MKSLKNHILYIFTFFLFLSLVCPVNAKQEVSTKKIHFKSYEFSDNCTLRIRNKNSCDVYVDLTIYFQKGKKIIDMQEAYSIPLQKKNGTFFYSFPMEKKKYKNIKVWYSVYKSTDDFSTKKIKVDDPILDDNEYFFHVTNNYNSRRYVTITMVFYRNDKLVAISSDEKYISSKRDRGLHILEPFNSNTYKDISYDKYRVYISSVES